MIIAMYVIGFLIYSVVMFYFGMFASTKNVLDVISMTHLVETDGRSVWIEGKKVTGLEDFNGSKRA